MEQVPDGLGLRLVDDELFREVYERTVRGILLDKSLRRKKVEGIKMQAPKFFSEGDTRSFGQKLQLQKLKEKSRRIKKKVVSEIAAASDLRIERTLEAKRRKDQQLSQRFNKVKDEFEKQKKIVERENTTTEKSKRIKKKGKKR